MKKSVLTLIIAVLLSACNKEPPKTENKTQPSPDIFAELNNSQSKNKPITEHDCPIISQSLATINKESRINDIIHIENQLKYCLPKADNDTQLQWADEYHHAYRRVAELWEDVHSIDDIDHNKRFNDAMRAIDDNQPPDSNEVKQLPLSAQSLIEFIENKKAMPIYICEGAFELRYNYQDFADLFTPHLPEDQAVFFNRLAKDNQETFWCDAGIGISLQELIDRALFWQDFIQKYPDSKMLNNAKILSQFYTYFLFFGSDNTDWTEGDHTSFTQYVYEDTNKSIEQHFIELSKHDSELGKKALTFVTFINTPTDERPTKYPIAKKLMFDKKTGEPLHEWAITDLRLYKALNLNDDFRSDDAPDCINAPLYVRDYY